MSTHLFPIHRNEHDTAESFLTAAGAILTALVILWFAKNGSANISLRRDAFIAVMRRCSSTMNTNSTFMVTVGTVKKSIDTS
jgi:hypothetical protein